MPDQTKSRAQTCTCQNGSTTRLRDTYCQRRYSREAQGRRLCKPVALCSSRANNNRNRSVATGANGLQAERLQVVLGQMLFASAYVLRTSGDWLECERQVEATRFATCNCKWRLEACNLQGARRRLGLLPTRRGASCARPTARAGRRRAGALSGGVCSGAVRCAGGAQLAPAAGRKRGKCDGCNAQRPADALTQVVTVIRCRGEALARAKADGCEFCSALANSALITRVLECWLALRSQRGQRSRANERTSEREYESRQKAAHPRRGYCSVQSAT